MDSLNLLDDGSLPEATPPERFDAPSQKIIDQRGLTCTLCSMVLSLAVQVTCGARFCAACFESLLNSDGQPTECPLCEKENPEEKMHLTKEEAHPDNFCRNQVRKLRILCPYNEEGCDWSGLFSKTDEYREHVASCEFGRDVAAGAVGNCSEVKHKVCTKCRIGINTDEHIEKICERVQVLEEEKKKALAELQQKVSPSGTNPLSLASSSGQPPGIQSVLSGASAGSTAEQYEGLLNKFKANTTLITVLFTEIKTCSHQIVTTQEDTKTEMINITRRLEVLEQIVTDMQGKIQRLESFNCDIPMSSTKGRLMWRIDDVDQKREDAASGINPALYSPPFSNDDASYKMCARLYLNGDGIGKDSHVSLFFVLMKGRFDTILQWPFKSRVTMMLMDQSGSGNHVQEKFRPDPNSSSFQRPRTEMNIATGCPRFISKADLDRRKQLYIREGAMFIQVVID